MKKKCFRGRMEPLTCDVDWIKRVKLLEVAGIVHKINSNSKPVQSNM